MKVLIADDHELFLKGLSFILEDLDESLQIILAKDYFELLSKAKTDTFDLILTDLNMPGQPWEIGLLKLYEITFNYKTPIIVLSAVYDKDSIYKALNIGIKGFISKTSSNEVILDAIKIVLQGDIYIPQEIIKENITAFAAVMNINHKSIETLTKRQNEVLKLISQGKCNQEIAKEMGLSLGTVKLHLNAIFKALEVSNRTEAIIKAAKIGF